MKENSPLVSVILPTYNRRSSLSRAVSSVLQQSYTHFELIVVDDGSTDGTERDVAALGDPRVVYIRLTQNRGAAVARNVGLQTARGEFVAFQDSDDEWLPGKLESHVSALAKLEDVALVYGPMVRVEGNRERLMIPPIFTPEVPDLYKQALGLGLQGIGIQSTMIRRRALLTVGGFDECLRRWIDLELFVRLARDHKFAYLDQPLVRYNFTKVSISSDVQALIDAVKHMLAKYDDELARHPSVRAVYHTVLMHCYLEQGEFQFARNEFWKVRSIRRPKTSEVFRVAASYLGRGGYAVAMSAKNRVGALFHYK